MKQTWRHLNILMSRNSKSSDIASVKSGDIDISDPKQIAETLNDFFFLSIKVPLWLMIYLLPMMICLIPIYPLL